MNSGMYTTGVALICWKACSNAIRASIRPGPVTLEDAYTQADFITANLYQEPLEGSWLRNRYDRILLDPPRSGAMQVVKQLPALHARRIVYVSCNPATLARDAQLLVNKAGYRLTAAGVMDMFPHTTHVESIAVFDAP